MSTLNNIGVKNPSGKRERIVISCVTFETVKVVDPIVFYDATIVHLINYIKDEADSNLKVYLDFCEEVKRQLKEKMNLSDDCIFLHRNPVYDFESMMQLMHEILSGEKARYSDDVDIYVNVSAGTSEYIAAATIASMMVPDVKPFSVSTKQYFIPSRLLKEIYYEGDRPVGMSKEVREPTILSTYPIEQPKEDLVRGLRTFHKMKQMKIKTSHKNVIKELINNGLWDYIPPQRNKSSHQTDDLKNQSVIMHYRRHFLEKWEGCGWIVKTGREHVLTTSGLCVINIFYK